MVGMSSNLCPFNFIFILGKRKNHKGQDEVSMEGGNTTGILFCAKNLNGKGSVSRSIVMVKKPTILKKLAAFFPKFFPKSLHVISHCL
jgi:hypothetical protein